MKQISLLLLLLTLAFQAEAGCLDSKKANAIREQIAVEIVDTKASDLCDSKSKAYKLFETLLFLKDIRFKPERIGRVIDQGLLARGFWNYLETQGLKRIAESSSPICNGQVYGYVDQANQPFVIFLCPLFFDRKVSTPDRAQLLLHEARHFSGHSHVDCRVGLWKGSKGGCDEAITEKGSYAVSAEAMARVGVLSSNLSKSAKANAKILALGYAQNRFNRPVLKNARGVYLTSRDNQAFIFNGKSLYQAPPVDDGVIVSLQSSVLVFPRDRMEKAYALNIFSSKEEEAASPLTAKYNLLEPYKRPELVDVLQVNEFLCFVQPVLVSCTHANGKQISFPSSLGFTKAMSSLELALPEQKNALYLLDGESQIFKLELKKNGTFEFTNTGTRLDGFKSVVSFPKGRLALRSNGELVIEKNGQWQAVPEAAGHRFDSLSRSFFWSPIFLED